MTDKSKQLSGEVEIEDPALILMIGEVFALNRVKEEITNAEIKSAGIGFSLAVIRRCTAEVQVLIAQRSLRIVTRAGGDISHADVTTIERGGRAFVTWETKAQGELLP